MNGNLTILERNCLLALPDGVHDVFLSLASKHTASKMLYQEEAVARAIAVAHRLTDMAGGSDDLKRYFDARAPETVRLLRAP